MMKLITALLFIFFFTFPGLVFSQLNDAVKFRITDSNGHTDETILRLHDSATSNWDDDWDAWKIFTPNPSYPSIYSHSAENFPLAINSMDVTEIDTTVGIWIGTPVAAGTYMLEVEFQGVFTSEIRIGVKDLLTGDQYFLENDMSFLFDVIPDPINDTERFRIFLSPKPIVEVFENQATVFNFGAIDWSSSLFLETDLPVQNTIVPFDSTVFISLLNGNYYSVATDDFGFIDTVFFIINHTIENPGNPLEEIIAAEISETNSTASIYDLEKETKNLTIYHDGESYYLKGEFEIPEDISIFIYSFDGALLSQDFYQNADMLNYEIPKKSSGVNSTIVVAYVGLEKYSFKLVQ